VAKLTPSQIFTLIHAENKRRGNPASGIAEITLTSIALAESGGDPSALNDKNNTPPGSRDRGLYQFNDHWNPDIPDADAFDPVKATEWAFIKSNNLSSFKPWTGSKGLRQPNINSTLTQLGFTFDISNNSVLDSAGQVLGSAYNTAQDTLSSFTSWAEGLAKLLSYLVNPTWWKRLGIGLLGALVIVAALILIFGKDVVKTVGDVTP
jgi:hypothetical protein